MRCTEAREALLETLTGRTPPDERRAVAAHLAECTACRQEAAGLEQTVAFLRSAPDPEPPEGFWAGFMARLDTLIRRHPVSLRARLARVLRAGGLVPAAATAAAALLFAVSSTVTRPALPVETSPQAQVAPYLTESMRTLLPHLDETVQIWQSGLGAQDAEPLFEVPPP